MLKCGKVRRCPLRVCGLQRNVQEVIDVIRILGDWLNTVTYHCLGGPLGDHAVKWRNMEHLTVWIHANHRAIHMDHRPAEVERRCGHRCARPATPSCQCQRDTGCRQRLDRLTSSWCKTTSWIEQRSIHIGDH